jgi:hypothetical protein
MLYVLHFKEWELWLILSFLTGGHRGKMQAFGYAKPKVPGIPAHVPVLALREGSQGEANFNKERGDAKKMDYQGKDGKGLHMV